MWLTFKLLAQVPQVRCNAFFARLLSDVKIAGLESCIEFALRFIVLLGQTVQSHFVLAASNNDKCPDLVFIPPRVCSL